MNTQQMKTELIKWEMEDTHEIRDDIAGWGEFTHRFCKNQIAAIQAAGLTGRPLLVRGDPGLGKSQLAPALASKLGFDFDAITIHADTEINDLLYKVDHVERLFLAQSGNGKLENTDALNIDKFVKHGILWRAIAPEKPVKKGLVVLIDEIDKAESSLPNALLEVLNNYTITVPAFAEPIQGDANRAVIFVLTSNDERELPAAFMRRCAILDLSLKDSQQLMDIFDCHQKRLKAAKLDRQSVQSLADDLIKYRNKQKEAHKYAPGTAEFLDIVSALAQFDKDIRDEKLAGLKKVFMYKKDQRD